MKLWIVPSSDTSYSLRTASPFTMNVLGYSTHQRYTGDGGVGLTWTKILRGSFLARTRGRSFSIHSVLGVVNFL